MRASGFARAARFRYSMVRRLLDRGCDRAPSRQCSVGRSGAARRQRSPSRIDAHARWRRCDSADCDDSGAGELDLRSNRRDANALANEMLPAGAHTLWHHCCAVAAVVACLQSNWSGGVGRSGAARRLRSPSRLDARARWGYGCDSAGCDGLLAGEVDRSSNGCGANSFANEAPPAGAQAPWRHRCAVMAVMACLLSTWS